MSLPTWAPPKPGVSWAESEAGPGQAAPQGGRKEGGPLGSMEFPFPPPPALMSLTTRSGSHMFAGLMGRALLLHSCLAISGFPNSLGVLPWESVSPSISRSASLLALQGDQRDQTPCFCFSR